MSILLVGKWESDVGYAWQMMAKFWIAIAKAYPTRRVILSFTRLRGVSPEIEAAGIECFEFPFDLSRPWDLVKFVRKHRITNIYFTDQPYSTWVYRLLRLAGVRKIIVHNHAPGMRASPQGVRRAAKSIAARLMGADSYIACSKFVLDRITNVGRVPDELCHLAQNGIVPNTLTRGDQTIRQELGLSPDTPAIVSCSRATQYKRIDHIIDAAATVRAARPNTPVCFIHCGDGPDLEAFAERIKKRCAGGYFKLLG